MPQNVLSTGATDSATLSDSIHFTLTFWTLHFRQQFLASRKGSFKSKPRSVSAPQSPVESVSLARLHLGFGRFHVCYKYTVDVSLVSLSTWPMLRGFRALTALRNCRAWAKWMEFIGFHAKMGAMYREVGTYLTYVQQGSHKWLQWLCGYTVPGCYWLAAILVLHFLIAGRITFVSV